jgi:hypothetical protein
MKALIELHFQHEALPLPRLRKLNTEPSIGASHQISAHFGQAVSEKIFRNRPIRLRQFLFLIGSISKTAFPLKPLGQMIRNLVGSIYGRSSEMSNRNRGLSKDASYQVSVHLAKRFQRRRI